MVSSGGLPCSIQIVLITFFRIRINQMVVLFCIMGT